ncbi:hypothetical protein [Bradyrhizobium sp. STM 3562]|uniref:hypothetical protein n=1 Tax=Bradyrhizobium sp. STM 3562 TaxID=578924 RepID=UPI00388D22EC
MPAGWDWKQPTRSPEPLVAANLFLDVAYQPDLNLLPQELRNAQVEVHVDAALMLRIRFLEILGEAEHTGEFLSGLRIEIGAAADGIDRSVSDPEYWQGASSWKQRSMTSGWHHRLV